MDLDFYFFETQEMATLLSKSGFFVKEVMERAPYEPYEYPLTRGYILAARD